MCSFLFGLFYSFILFYFVFSWGLFIYTHILPGKTANFGLLRGFFQFLLCTRNQRTQNALWGFSRRRQCTQRRRRTALSGVSFCKYPIRQRSAVLGKSFLEDSGPPWPLSYGRVAKDHFRQRHSSLKERFKRCFSCLSTSSRENVPSVIQE